MNLKDYHNIYLIGIGGIGMSAIARWFKANGHFVAGYDRTETELTKNLQSEGIEIHFEDDETLLPEAVIKEIDKTLVIYTPAIPDSHTQYNYIKGAGYKLLKRSEVLGEITKTQFTIAVAGTHGKTTTSSMIAHILNASGKNCTAFIGGIMTNYDSNILIGKNPEESIIVVEADEFDRSFLTIHPDIAIITSVDADHLDIYGTKNALKKTFREFIGNIKPNGQLFIEEMSAQDLGVKNLKGINVDTYGLSMGSIKTNNLDIQNAKMSFDYKGKFEANDLKLPMPGLHNVENCVGAISAAGEIGISVTEITSAIESYRGVKRRFEYILDTDDLVYIDDYAHHPEEISSLLDSIKLMYPKNKMTVVFQPHLYSRTRDFASGFRESLSIADEVLMLNIYPAREKPIDGVNAEMLLENLDVVHKELCTKSNLIEKLKNRKLEILLTVGAGDIDTVVKPIKEAFTN